MTTPDPFSRCPVPSGAEYAGTVLETPQERAARIRHSIAEAEEFMASGAPMVTLDDVIGEG